MQDLSQRSISTDPIIGDSDTAVGVCCCTGNNIGKKLTSFVMFFESSRRYDCQLESREYHLKSGNLDFSSSSDSSNSYVTLRSQTPMIDCHGDHIEALNSSRFRDVHQTLGTTTMTTGETCEAPLPAPRKSLYRDFNVACIPKTNTSESSLISKRSGRSYENFSRNFELMRKTTISDTIKLRALKFQQSFVENCNLQRADQALYNRSRNPMTPTNQSDYIIPQTTIQRKNIKLDLDKLSAATNAGNKVSRKESNEDKIQSLSNNDTVAPSSFVEDESDDDSTTDIDTEDSQGNKLDKPRPGKLDLRQFDNITTAIGKLSVQTTSSSSTKTTLTTTTSKPIDSTKNTRRLPKNPRQNHGRAVAPPKLPSTILTKGSGSTTSKSKAHKDYNSPTNETISQLNSDNNSAIDFSQSPIAQRLLKHSKDHKVSELNSPYESDSEQTHQQISHNFVRGHSEFTKESSGFLRNSTIDSSELINSRGATIRQLNEILANKQPPGRPGGQRDLLNKGNSLDQPDLQGVSANSKKTDRDNKKDKKKIRSEEKLEKQKLKEEERHRRQEEEKLRRQEKKLGSKKSKANSTGSNSVGDDGIPLFIKRCIEYIESEGLDAEGIYRVPGNRAHVDAFVQKFKENPDMSIVESDVPVNAVATALKDFLSKKWGPIIPLNLMNELTELSSIAEKERRVEAVRELVQKLPRANYCLLKYVFSHFVRVSLNHSLNSMDSKNLAICWWPTLLPLHFNDMVMFEQMRPHLEESIQTMIDQYDFIFEAESPKTTVT